MAKPDTVKIINGMLDDFTDHHGKQTIILRGSIDLSTLANLKRDDYQRDRFSAAELKKLTAAIEAGKPVLDIELGMRGQSFMERENNFYLRDSVYIIDGLQRATATALVLEKNPHARIQLGARIHFDTTLEWEREWFEALNTNQRKLSPNKLLANKRADSDTLATLYGLATNDKSFPLYERVQWGQAAARNDLVTGLVLLKVAGRLHSHKGAGKSVSWKELVPAVDRMLPAIGMQNFRENVKTFFELVDECWGIRSTLHKDSAAHLRGPFLDMLAQLLSDHLDFWKADPKERKLFIDAPLRRKFAQFPIRTDRTIQSLASASGKSRDHLYQLLRDHINSGKRTKRLTPRNPATAEPAAVELDDAA
jgi:hypothetical protein